MQDYDNEGEQNRFLILGFWEFAIIATLMVVFFPWSLLFCVFYFGFEDTKFLLAALLHDLVKTFLAVLAVIVPLIISIIVLVFALNS